MVIQAIKKSVRLKKWEIPLIFSIIDGLSIYIVMMFYYYGTDLSLLININLATSALYLALNYRGLSGPPLLIFVFLISLFIAFIKIFYQSIYLDDINYRFTFTNVYGLVMPIFALSFCKNLQKSDSVDLVLRFKKLAKIYFIVIGPGMVLYYYLYFTGSISYFGLGFSLQYFLPFVISKLNLNYFLIFAIVLLSGKRAAMVVFIAQSILVNLKVIKRNILFGLVGIILFAVCLVVAFRETDLLHRFNWVFDGSFDINDQQSSVAAAGGRFEEVEEVIRYLDGNMLKYIFGTLPTESYTQEEYTDRELVKNYTHISFFGYIFRYGIFNATLIFGSLIWFGFLGIRNITEISIAVVGIIIVSFTGANLMTDPTPWVMIGYYYKINKNFNRLNK